MTPKDAMNEAGRLASERANMKASWEAADADFARDINDCGDIWAPAIVPFKVGDRMSHIPFITGSWEITALCGKAVMSYGRGDKEPEPVFRVTVSLQNVRKDGTLGTKYKKADFHTWNADQWIPEGETYEPPDLSGIRLD